MLDKFEVFIVIIQSIETKAKFMRKLIIYMRNLWDVYCIMETVLAKVNLLEKLKILIKLLDICLL